MAVAATPIIAVRGKVQLPHSSPAWPLAINEGASEPPAKSAEMGACFLQKDGQVDHFPLVSPADGVPEAKQGSAPFLEFK